jgi:ATP-binding cassette subfamily F protein uup
MMVLEAKGVGYRYDDKPLIKDFDTLIARGDKVGIIGPNGCGKTTLVRLLLGELAPQTGTVRQGTQLSITYFDQLRRKLDEDKSVWENVLPNGSTVTIDGKSKHIIGYLQDFLFTPERAKTRVRYLSGGERNRLLLAQLFTQPANLLVLDEPTNDLDSETLELLEELLVNFQGTVLLICHDRAFLDNVVTQTVAADGDGHWREYVGGYSDWLRQRPATKPSPGLRPTSPARAGEVARSAGEGSGSLAKPAKSAPTKLSYKETRELEQLPKQIEALEDEQKALAAAMGSSDYHKRGGEQMRKDAERATEIEQWLETAFERWVELDAKKNAMRG